MADQTSILSQHWTDIVTPAAPTSGDGWLLLSVLVLLLLVVAVVTVLWQRRPRQRALRELRLCQRLLAARIADPRPVARRIYSATLTGLALHPAQLARLGKTNLQWQQFYQRLQACVFERQQPTSSELHEIIQQARGYLKLRGFISGSCEQV